MSFDIMGYEPKGDKKNSDFFNEYRLKIYGRREESGLSEMLGGMKGIVIQVQHGDALAYLEELYSMSPYRFDCARLNDTHKVYFLSSKPEQPRMIVLEPLSDDYQDDLTRLNMLYPKARPKPHARYVGEIYHTKDLAETRRVLESHEIRFHEGGQERDPFFANQNFAFTVPSDFTGNRIGYAAIDLDPGAIDFGQRLELTDTQRARLDAAEEQSREAGISELLRGPDHMATRILAGEREDAILEFLTMSNYYFWGAYNIKDMNSSTNVNRNPNISDETLSPAKVFTANNTPSFVNSFEGRPMPTEDFVRNYGRR
ncbi:MAG: hypothetical protein AAF436_22040, partial [Myxococcota bacterium]